MNENINLSKILKGCEKTKLYCSLMGEYVTLVNINRNKIIVLTKNNKEYYFFHNGADIHYPDGECIIFPAKDQRDWSKFERPIPVDTPMMVKIDDEWVLRYYKGFDEDVGHTVFLFQWKSTDLDNDGDSIGYKYMIPYNKFDPNNIKESLKYNIRK